jgi:hypothetical protein
VGHRRGPHRARQRHRGPLRQRSTLRGRREREGHRAYDIVSRTEPLKPADGAFLRTGKGLDNLLWEEQDKVLIAARHPDAAAFARHASRLTFASPSRILRVPLNGQSPTELYRDNGDELSAASVGISWMNHLYLGQVFEKGVLGCAR